jgi:glycosyltransferase involved in cell wall biosynthesis
MNKPIPIILPIRNRPSLTTQTIKTIYENTKYPFKLIACDDASDAAWITSDLDRLQREYGFTLIKNEVNIGITPTKERCMDAIDFDYDYLYVSDNDYWYRDGWLTLLVEKLQKYPDIKVIGGTTYPLHKVTEVREDVVITEIQTGGTMLMSKETKDWFPKWTQDWHVSAEVQRRGFNVAHLANPLYVLHCGVKSVSGRLDETKTIQGKLHIGAEAYIRTLAEQVGADCG